MRIALLAFAFAAAAHAQRILPSEQLQVNTDDSVRYVTTLPFKEGLASLEDLVFSSEYEEAWAYDEQKKQWLEVGYDASGWDPLTSIADLQMGVARASNSVRYDPGCSDALTHSHPIKDAPDYRYARALDALNAIAIVKVNHAIPTPADLEALRQEECPFYIASFGGVTEYHLTAKGREKLRDAAFLDGITARIQESVAAAFKQSGDRIDPVAVLNNAFSQASDERFRIRFASYRNLDDL